MSNIPEPPLGFTEVLGEECGNPPNPRTTGEILIGLGREFLVSSLESRIKGQFEQWVRANAKRVIAFAEVEEGPEEADKLRSVYVRDYGAGHYTWDGRHIRSALEDVPGVRYLMFLLLRRCQPEITMDEVKALFRENGAGCGLAIRWAKGNSEASLETKEQAARQTQTSQGKVENYRNPPKTLDSL